MSGTETMQKHLVLFDIDATLLLTGGAGMRSMVRAGSEILGPELCWDGIEPSGGLDPILFAEAARQSGLTWRPEDHEAFRRRYAGLLEDELVRSKAGVRAMPGVHRLLEDLRGRPEITLGVLTGNYPETAKLKLRAVELDPDWFRVAVFADEATSRPGLVEVALAKYERLHREPIPPSPRRPRGRHAAGCGRGASQRMPVARRGDRQVPPRRAARGGGPRGRAGPRGPGSALGPAGERDRGHLRSPSGFSVGPGGPAFRS